VLTKEQNDLLTHVGPGTPMGELMRRYWIPALRSVDLAEPNGDPAEVRILGENFVAWRDQAGRIGFFDELCMHRGASLALARCEGDGLRCLYHGWKYAADGTILETPNYKPPAIKKGLRAPVYPVHEEAGLIWVYLGPEGKRPDFPRFAFMLHGEVSVDEFLMPANFLQVMEGTVDSTHVSQLHRDTFLTGYGTQPDPALNGRDAAKVRNTVQYVDEDTPDFTSDDDIPVIELSDLTFGTECVFIHDAWCADRQTKFCKAYMFILPFLTIGSRVSATFSVPIDDVHTKFFFCLSTSDLHPSLAQSRQRSPLADTPSHGAPTDAGNPDPNTVTSAEVSTVQRWRQDRAAMRAGTSFSGMPGVLAEDFAMTGSMGAIYDRTKEHLVPADAMVIRIRRRLLQAVEALARGEEPTMLRRNQSESVSLRSGLLDDPATWRELLLPGNAPHRLTAGNTSRSRMLGVSRDAGGSGKACGELHGP
jgi:phthalate 4,5-dioxygenase oxygenase subunit